MAENNLLDEEVSPLSIKQYLAEINLFWYWEGVSEPLRIE